MFQPTKASLNDCTISGISYLSDAFHVKELRVYEDICKAYFTGQLVIETSLNNYENFLAPTIPVIFTFEAPRSDGGATKTYTEAFRVYSYDSKPLSGGGDARIEHTIQLIGQEYYNDRHNTVLQNFSNVTGTEAARQIHSQYMSVNGGLKILLPSMGMIGQEKHPHQVKNMKPIKAIHDLLDRMVFAQYKSSAPVYYRNKQGYVMAPLQHILENGTIAESFKHIPAQGASLAETMGGYNNVIHMRPLAPAGETSSGASAGDVSGLMQSSSYFDLKTGNYIPNLSSLGNLLKLDFVNNTPGLKGKLQEMLQSANKNKYGGRMLFGMLDELLQQKSVDKNGPGGYAMTQEAFLSALNYSQKYWVSVPLQTGVNVTCGQRINVIYPINDKLTAKTLFIPRLIHELRFTEGKERTPVNINGTTDFYCVLWGNG